MNRSLACLRVDIEVNGLGTMAVYGWGWSLIAYRLSGSVEDVPGLVGAILRLMTSALRVYIRLFTGIDINRKCHIGKGLRIFHGGNIVINSGARIGDNCVLMHGVTIGNRTPGGPAPRIGDYVEIGAKASVLGEVVVGDGARIGAMSLVIADVPAGAVVAGVPARVLH